MISRDEVEAFRNEYLATWWDLSPNDNPLRLLALEYHQSCEDYDWTICRHHEGRFAQPVTREERELSLRHAKHELRRLNGIVRQMRLSGPDTLWQVIKKAEPSFTANYIPPHLRPAPAHFS